jgi:hypothetical protein
MQFEKQDSPITLTLLGIRIDLIAHPQKANLPISFNLEAESNETSQRDVQTQKHLSPITSTLLGILIDFIAH